MKKKIIYFACGLVAYTIALWYLYSVSNPYAFEDDKTIVKDSAWIDTMYIPYPVFDTVDTAGQRTVSISKDDVADVDISEGDSVFIVLATTRHYTDDSTYSAWVSGIEPQLDSIHVYHTTTFREVMREKIVYKPLAPTEKTLNLGGFINANTSIISLQHINLRGGMNLCIKNKYNIQAGYNLGEYSYPFVGFEYRFNF